MVNLKTVGGTEITAEKGMCDSYLIKSHALIKEAGLLLDRNNAIALARHILNFYGAEKVPTLKPGELWADAGGNEWLIIENFAYPFGQGAASRKPVALTNTSLSAFVKKVAELRSV